MRSAPALTLILLCGLCRAESPPAGPSGAAVKQLRAWLEQPEDQRPPLEKTDFANTPLTKQDAATAQELLWLDWQALIRRTRAEEMRAKQITLGEQTLRFDYRTFGKQPKDGHSLFLSLHGGGGTPTQVNDQQWENQKRLYEPAEGIYLSPRAPTDTWNLWHQDHVDRLLDRLIENLIVLEEINPDRVYLMGYSAGGDGVYQLAPRMAERWAAAAMMAGHPNEASPLGLRNVGFTLHMGGNDGAYNRNQVAREWKTKLAELREQDPQGYPHEVVIHNGLGHWMNRRDAVAVPWMAKFTRNPIPEKIVWKQDDVTREQFYWLGVPAGKANAGSEVTVIREGHTVQIVSHRDLDSLRIRLRDDMLDLDQPVVVQVDGKTHRQLVPRTIATLHRTLHASGDLRLTFSGEIKVQLTD